MKIQVTHNDIIGGVKRHCNFCPIARAMTRAFGEEVTIGSENGGGVYWFGIADTIKVLPKIAFDFMTRFDAGQQVEPFEFDL